MSYLPITKYIKELLFYFHVLILSNSFWPPLTSACLYSQYPPCGEERHALEYERASS